MGKLTISSLAASFSQWSWSSCRKKTRRRPEVHAVHRYDLWARRRLQRRLIVAAERRGRKIEVGFLPAGTELADAVPQPGVEIPIHVVAVGHGGMRPQRQRAPEEAIADGGGKEPAPFADFRICPAGTAGAGEKEQPKPFGAGLRRRKGRERPRLAQGSSAATRQGQGIRPIRLEAGGMELPEHARRVVHPARDPGRSDSQCGRGRQRTVERDLDQDPGIADGGQEMPNAAGIPIRSRGRSSLTRQQWKRQSPEDGRSHGAGRPGKESPAIELTPSLWQRQNPVGRTDRENPRLPQPGHATLLTGRQ